MVTLMPHYLSLAACISLTLVSCTIVPIDHSKVDDSMSASATGTAPSPLAVENRKVKPQGGATSHSGNYTGEPQENIEAAWEHQMAEISSKGTESYVLGKGGVVDNIADIMRDCANSLKVHGRNGMGKPRCADFIEYQERYNDFSALFILTALYQRDFIENKIDSNTLYSYPAESVLKQAYAAHQDYEIIVGQP